MDKLNQEIRKRYKLLTEIAEKAELILKHHIDGNLEVVVKERRFQYYLHKSSGGKRQRTYIRKKDTDTAKKIARRDYAKRILTKARHEMEAIENFLKLYSCNFHEEIYQGMHAGRKLLVEPVVPMKAEIIKAWVEGDNGLKNMYPIGSGVMTEYGEVVRSKSEKIIADKLFLKGIPYKYEQGLILEGRTIFPDFTVMNPDTLEIFIWEHLGMVDNADYIRKNIEKLKLYERNGYYPGVNLILTYETADAPLSTDLVNAMIGKIMRA